MLGERIKIFLGDSDSPCYLFSCEVKQTDHSVEIQQNSKGRTTKIRCGSMRLMTHLETAALVAAVSLQMHNLHYF